MCKRITILCLMIFLIYSTTNGQCYSSKGILNEACKSLTIVKPPAFDIAVGLSNANIFKVDVNYITENEIVYGGALGFRMNKPKIPGIDQGDATFNAFLGYNLVGCIIVGVTAGVSHYVNDYVQNDKPIKTSGYKQNIGMSIKLISNYTSFPVTFGCYGSQAGIGLTVGTIF